ncbi:MAG TPA: glycosyltransferase family 39 protein [Candidatus Acidoferrales bacterium]|nr:glycosyltransferase family 39 protein [Candidatus Acidoferrales bacterium]
MADIQQAKKRRDLAVWLMAALVTLICLFGNLGAMGLVGPDEPRYAWIARAIVETSDWVTPRLYGQPWFEKPILYYWAAAAGFRLHLPAEWAARLPSALAALAAALAVGWLAREHYDSDAASFSSPYLLAPLIFSTSIAAIGFSRAATPDMLFSASITLAMASAARAFRRAGALYSPDDKYDEARRADLLPIALFGVFLGFGVLAKGPAAIILAGGAIGLWALATKRWRAALRTAHPLAVAAFCVVALPWYVLCAIRNPDFLRIFIFQHNFERYLTPMFQHRQPFWFFLPITLLAILPWTVFLWPALQEALRVWKQRSWAHSPGFFFGCWAVFPVIFFSFSQSKLPGYILPAIPPLALLCSISALRALRHSPARRRALLVGIATSWLLIGFAAAHSIVRINPGLAGLSHFFGGAAVVVGLLLIGASFYRTGQWVIPLCILFVAASLETVNVRLLPALDRFYSARPHAEFMHNDLRPDRIFTYQLSRSWDYGLAFYFRRQLPEWSPTDRDAALVLTTPAGLREITRLDRFRGVLNDNYEGILYVPVIRVPSLR